MTNKPWTQDELDYLKANYKTSTHAEIAKKIGRSRNAVRSRASLMGFHKKIKKHNDTVYEIVREAYENRSGKPLDIDKIVEATGTNRQWVSKVARGMGLSDQTRPRGEEHCKAVSRGMKKWMSENEHPRGATGMKHTQETRKAIGKKSKERWDSMTDGERAEQVGRGLKTREMNGTLYNPRHKTTWKSGWREIGGRRIFARSAWEANIARYYQFLKDRGEIHEWEHEPETFWFDKIKRGCRSYLPDFRITEKPDSEPYYVEVKGWMDARSKTKLKRFAKYYPQHRLELIEAKRYKAIAKTAGGLIDGWE